MKIVETELKGVIVIKPDVFKDDRGYFLESYNSKRYSGYDIDVNFVQDNISKSIKNTIRGIHYQVGEFAQGKLCEVLSGKVKDVAVDLRKSSPTFGKYTSAILSEENHYQIWIPEGFGHGFSVLSDEAVFHYKCTNFYSKEHERAIYYADPDIAIDWEIQTPLVSPKDLQAKLFRDKDTEVFV
jgi:dTDP-4-dehydrorhamnose 3,5-epimerase